MAGKRIVKIAPELITEALRNKQRWNVEIECGLPAPTRILDVELVHDFSNGSTYVRMLLESDFWPDLEEGEIIPNFMIVVRDKEIPREV